MNFSQKIIKRNLLYFGREIITYVNVSIYNYAQRYDYFINDFTHFRKSKYLTLLTLFQPGFLGKVISGGGGGGGGFRPPSGISATNVLE